MKFMSHEHVDETNRILAAMIEAITEVFALSCEVATVPVDLP